MKILFPTAFLQKILDKARISPLLRTAIEDTIKAIKDRDLDLAYQLTACKSHIIGSLVPENKQYAFQEDHEYNKTHLKNSVYGLLDTIHHDIAWQINKMPSGMVAVSLGPKEPTTREMKPAGTHPVVKRIKYEMNRLHREVRNQNAPRQKKVLAVRKINWSRPQKRTA